MIANIFFWAGVVSSSTSTVILVLALIFVGMTKNSRALYHHEHDFLFIAMPALFFLGSIAAKYLGW